MMPAATKYGIVSRCGVQLVLNHERVESNIYECTNNVHRPLSYTANPKKSQVIQTVHLKNGGVAETILSLPTKPPASLWNDPASLYDWAWLRSKKKIAPQSSKILRVADLFCGSGGLSLGAVEAITSIHHKAEIAFAVDNDLIAMDVYQKNLKPRHSFSGAIEEILDGEVGHSLTFNEKNLKKKLGKIDILLGGPPCQGHSDLNNHTRRNDPRNKLIMRVVRFAEVFRPAHVIIENVQGSAHDHTGFVQLAEQSLINLGYDVKKGLLLASDIGAAQKRRRFFMVASLNAAPEIEAVAEAYSVAERTIKWACADLKVVEGNTFDSSAKHSEKNQQRINYLHDNGLYELPDAERPDCHRLKPHRYSSVYGRMYWDRPAPTITTGFGSTGQGRFVHPKERRTLTPHEAARIQFFPDFFDFGVIGRGAYQDLIGNAVPPKLGFVLTLELIR